ncbi:MAG: hypothetical protein JW995_16315, partial [Melioribacteraceae bacterium]|nr:hypothetical protein [Melioribacteraceae bacterium]
MEESIEKRIPKIVFEIFIILFGYCILIVLFSLVGYQISSDKLIFGNLLSTSNNFLDIFKNLFNSIPKPIRFFVIILTPIYLHRALLYDTDVKEHDSKQDQILKISNWFPFLFFIVLVIFSFVYFWTVENIDYDKFWDISIKILLVFVPYLFFIGYRVLCKDSEFKEKFKYRTLFPAIFTGLFSFLFGWAINIDISISGWAIIFSWVLFYLIFSASIRFKTVSKSGESIDHNRKVINIAVSLLSPLFLAALFSTYPSGEI